VFSELQKRGDEIFFYNKENECDFIIKNEGKLIAIQVCYELNEHNQAREVNGLLKLPFEVHERVILTYNQSMSLGEVSVVPFWEYFF
jgi:predicted AAA+ superfamily ATPase